VGISCSSAGNDGSGLNECCIHGGSPFADGGRFAVGEGVTFMDRRERCWVDDMDCDRGRGSVECFRLVGECRAGVVVLSSRDSDLVRLRL
jgi:hypothetical protein